MKPSAQRSSPQRAASPIAVVTGAAGGLGTVIARRLHDEGYAVYWVGRNRDRLHQATADVQPPPEPKHRIVCDVTDDEAVRALAEALRENGPGIDVLVNVVGESDRGAVIDLTADRIRELIETNVLSALRCSQALLPQLEMRRGVIVNVGSLAAKVGARYLGAYPTAKHALAGLTQQMRLEWHDRGVHVGLINPGPIRREDAGFRYAKQVATGNLPAEAARPGGGTTIKGLDPERVATAVVRMIRRRAPDILLPAHLRPLVAIGHLWPPLGDWLLRRFTRSSAK